MSIQWNKVTWYSKLIAVILFLATFALAFYLGEQYGYVKEQLEFAAGTSAPAPVGVKTDLGNAIFKVGETKMIQDMRVTLSSVEEDSRCATGVQCIWAGKVKLLVTLQEGSQKQTEEVLTDTEPNTFNNYKFDIEQILPEKKAGVEIQKNDYRITLHFSVTK